MDELERRGQEIADAMGRYRGTEPLIEAVRRMSNQLHEALRSKEFYELRINALQEYQKELPEPYRTEICNILANGMPHAKDDGQAKMREQARAMLSEARAQYLRDLPTDLPDTAETPRQRELAAKHGTPKAFAESCAEAIGEISPLEAATAVRRYLSEWEAS